MFTFVGSIIGVAAGLWISHAFIFPADVLHLHPSTISIGDLLRIIGGIFVTFGVAGIGGIIGETFDD